MKQPFEQVVATHGDTVLRVCRVVVGFHDAEDAWSETFMAALRAYPDLPVDANLEAWLVTIAHRKAIDVLRKRRREGPPIDTLPERVSGIGIPDANDHGLWEAVGRLPLKQRQAVAYHYFAGLPYAEIAAVIGGSTEAARKASSDGIKRLRASMTEKSPNEETS